jgi:protocatechuate 3,4-dioxygenase beta subunit
MKTEELSRRDLMKWGGAAVASISLGTLESIISGCKGAPIAQPDSRQQGAAPDACLQATNTTRGPYFVDHALDPNIDNDVVDPNIPERSDITTDTEGNAGKQAGLPLTLKLTIASYSSGNGGVCAPLPQARVDIWHCNAQGVYSDVQVGEPPPGAPPGGAPLPGGISDGSPTAVSTQDQNFLRGYQRTDANGQVTFQTIYPGWYMGRAVHIHVKIRLYDASGNVMTEATTQLFFNEAVSDSVYAGNAAYSRSGTRDTRNDSDMIYESESPPLLVNLTGSATTGYTGTVTLGIQTGQVFGG